VAARSVIDLVEHGVLTTVLDLHPQHLTAQELVRKVAGDRDGSEGESIRQAIRDLRASQVLRYTGSVVEPTHAAVRTAELLALS
jgi:hypothetical protein